MNKKVGTVLIVGLVASLFLMSGSFRGIGASNRGSYCHNDNNNHMYDRDVRNYMDEDDHMYDRDRKNHMDEDDHMYDNDEKNHMDEDDHMNGRRNHMEER